MDLTAFQPARDFGKGVYQITRGPLAHTHTYHKYCPWNGDMSGFIYFEYEKGVIEGRLVLMDWPSGKTRIIGTSTHWGAHSVANQFWLGPSNRILYQTAGYEGEPDGGIVYGLVDPDGGSQTFRAPAYIGAGDERILVGRFSFGQLFPDDRIGNRDRLGLLAVDPDTAGVTLLCSLRQIVENHPRRDEIEPLHLFTKTYLLHNRLNKVAFNVANSPYFNAGEDPAKMGDLHVFDLDTRTLTFVGTIGHHPIWHPSKPWLLSFSDDEQGRRRLTFDKLLDNGTIEREFLAYFSTSGHPSVDPTERYIFIDNYEKPRGTITLDLFDMETKKTHPLCQCKRNTFGYPTQQLTRREGETVVDFGTRADYSPHKAYIVQAHPAWDRTGRYVAFNSDQSGESQIYVIDMAERGFFKN